MKRVTREEYLKNPCKAFAYAYWRNKNYDYSNHEFKHEINTTNDKDSSKFIKMIHKLDQINEPKNDDYTIIDVDFNSDLSIICDILEKGYDDDNYFLVEQVEDWTKLCVFDYKLWIFAVDKQTGQRVGVGIANLDNEINEGSIEWVQALPKYNNKGVKELLINELLTRLKGRADFVTADDRLKAKEQYKNCGFTGDDVWVML